MNIRDIPDDAKEELHVLKARMRHQKLADTIVYLLEKNRDE